MLKVFRLINLQLSRPHGRHNEDVIEDAFERKLEMYSEAVPTKDYVRIALNCLYIAKTIFDKGSRQRTGLLAEFLRGVTATSSLAKTLDYTRDGLKSLKSRWDPTIIYTLQFDPFQRQRVPEAEIDWLIGWIKENSPPQSGSKSDDVHHITVIWQTFYKRYCKAAAEAKYLKLGKDGQLKPRSLSFIYQLALDIGVNYTKVEYLINSSKNRSVDAQ